MGLHYTANDSDRLDRIIKLLEQLVAAKTSGAMPGYEKVVVCPHCKGSRLGNTVTGPGGYFESLPCYLCDGAGTITETKLNIINERERLFKLNAGSFKSHL